MFGGYSILLDGTLPIPHEMQDRLKVRFRRFPGGFRGDARELRRVSNFAIFGSDRNSDSGSGNSGFELGIPIRVLGIRELNSEFRVGVFSGILPRRRH